jgi:hypothetical protein
MGTSPSFFKVPVTQALVRCVESGEFPSTETVVTGHVPVIPHPLKERAAEGMVNPENRGAILQCYESFKKFVD